MSSHGRRIFTTQLLVNGHPANAREGLIRGMNPEALQTLLVDFAPMPASRIGELAATFDIALGITAEELDGGALRGIGAP